MDMPQTAIPVTIPGLWLVGACYTRELAGMSPREAIEDAVRCWHEQERLALQAWFETAERNTPTTETR